MPSKKQPIPPSSTSHLFGGRKPNDRGAAMTSERIASDLAEFRKSGGRIEVLGITRSLTRIDGGDQPATAAPAKQAAGTRRRTS